MLNGCFRGERVGSGTHLWKFSETVKAGAMTAVEFVEAEALMSRSAGACNTMGTASTMAGMAGALGMALSGNAAIPAVDSPHLMQHRRRAVVFEDIDDYKARIGDEALDIDETCIMVMKNCGPRGYPGMAEVGYMGLPPKVLRKRITDIARISDARMSGTAYGTVVQQVAPEAAQGGPLAVVRTGDFIEVDVAGRRLHPDIPAEELAARLAAWKSPVARPNGGSAQLDYDHVQGADTGADLDFLIGPRGNAVAREAH